MASAATSAMPDAGNSTMTQRVLVLISLTFVTMLYTMTVMIANVALPKMQGTFAATADQIALVVTFNIVATAVVTPASGWLASRFSRRTLMFWCAVGFTAASFLCGVAQSLEELVMFRILQGAFGAPLVPLAQATILDTFPRHQHGTATAVFSMGVVFGPIIGPTVGGFLAEELGWRWVFFLLVPFGLIAIAGILIVIQDRRRAPRVGLDWFGFITLSIAIASFQFMLDRGQRQDWFESPEIVIEAALASLCFYLFLAHVTTTERPFLNLAIFIDRNYAVGCAIMFLFGMVLWGPMVLFPPMMANIQGYPEAEIGVFMALRGIGTLASSLVMAFVNRWFDPRLLLVIGFVLQGVAAIYMGQFDINLSPHALAWTSLLAGFGVGFIWVPLTLITFRTLDKAFMNEATAVYHLIRNVGSSIFISVTVAMVIRTTATGYSEMVPFVTIFSDATSLLSLRGDWPTDSVRGLAGLGAEMRRQSSLIGYLNAFNLYAALCFAIIPLVVLVKYRRG